MFIVETDAKCKTCGETHFYTTTQPFCQLAVFTNEATARMVARRCEGIVRKIDRVPDEVGDYTIFTARGGAPDPAIPTGVAKL